MIILNLYIYIIKLWHVDVFPAFPLCLWLVYIDTGSVVSLIEFGLAFFGSWQNRIFGRFRTGRKADRSTRNWNDQHAELTWINKDDSSARAWWMGNGEYWQRIIPALAKWQCFDRRIIKQIAACRLSNELQPFVIDWFIQNGKVTFIFYKMNNSRRIRDLERMLFDRIFSPVTLFHFSYLQLFG